MSDCCCYLLLQFLLDVSVNGRKAVDVSRPVALFVKITNLLQHKESIALLTDTVFLELLETHLVLSAHEGGVESGAWKTDRTAQSCLDSI